MVCLLPSQNPVSACITAAHARAEPSAHALAVAVCQTLPCKNSVPIPVCSQSPRPVGCRAPGTVLAIAHGRSMARIAAPAVLGEAALLAALADAHATRPLTYRWRLLVQLDQTFDTCPSSVYFDSRPVANMPPHLCAAPCRMEVYRNTSCSPYVLARAMGCSNTRTAPMRASTGISVQHLRQTSRQTEPVQSRIWMIMLCLSSHRRAPGWHLAVVDLQAQRCTNSSVSDPIHVFCA